MPLAEAALLMACEEYPHLSLPPYLEDLDRMAARTRERIGPEATPLETIAGLNHVLFGEFGFCGNTAHYDDPRNSFLNEVIERRTGIPITLSAIYIAVADRLNFTIDGVGLPGHFVVRHRWDCGEVFLDPFNKGARLTQGELEDLTRRAGAGTAVEPWLRRATNRQILTRMLNNLKTIYINAGIFDKALSMIDLMMMTDPAAVGLYRQRGLLRLQVRQFEGAARDFRRYVENLRSSQDPSRIRESVRDLARIQAMLN